VTLLVLQIKAASSKLKLSKNLEFLISTSRGVSELPVEKGSSETILIFEFFTERLSKTTFELQIPLKKGAAKTIFSTYPFMKLISKS